MPGLFQAIELGKRALLTHQINLQTIGHNIANVNTPGYTRQRVNIVSSMPDNNANYSVGTGVSATDVRHIRDLFLGEQFRQENKSLGQWSYKETTLSQIEALFAEPGDNTLSDQLNEFWSAWSDLANNPNSASVRSEIIQQANLLINGFHEVAGQMMRLQESIDRDLVNITFEVNRLSDEIGRLNHQITRSEVGGVNANDLRDIRDHLVDELSGLVDVNTREDSNGSMVVYMGAMALVDGDLSNHIGANVVNYNGQVRHELTWKGTTIEIRNNDGQLKGLVDSRDSLIPGYLEQLNTLSQAIVENVNALHNTGINSSDETGVNFFDPMYTDAATIRISSDILSDESRVMSGMSGEASDNRIALELSQLGNARLVNDNTTSINDYYNSMIGALGVKTSEAISFSDNYDLLVNQIDNARQSVQGVSLDEEMTNMIKYQHAYDAAARIITAMDQALDTVISGMGVVGR